MHVCEIKIHVMGSLKDMNQDYCRLRTSAFWANSSKDFFFSIIISKIEQKQ